jgi:hypothetical protein
MTITTSTPDSLVEVHLRNLETVLLRVDTMDELTIDESNVLSKKEAPGYFSFITDYFTTNESEKIRHSIEHMLYEINTDRETYGQYKDGKEILDGEIKVLITEKFIPAGEGFFNPHCLVRMKNIQNILVPKLKDLRERKNSSLEKILKNKDITEFNREDINYSEKKALKKAKQLYLNEYPNYKMEIAIAKAELMFLLRIGTNINKGATSSIIVSWFGKKNIGIFKPEISNQTWQNLFVNYFKYQMGMQISHLKTARMAQPKAEVAAHILAEHFGLKITCPTKIVTLEKTEGSFQLFAPGMKEIKDIFHLLENIVKYHPNEILYFQLMAILDYVLGNLDGHGENCLVEEGSDGCLIDKLYKIDNANTFITCNTTRKLITDSKQYIWSILRIAEVTFCDEAKELMLKMTPEAIDEVIDKIRKELHGFLNQGIIDLLHQRAKVLYAMAKIETSTPRELGQLQTDEEINTFLKENTFLADEITVARTDEDFYFIDNYPNSLEFKSTSSDSDHE